jgi:hypothetical protein
MIDPNAPRNQRAGAFLKNPLEVCRRSADKEHAESLLWHPPGMVDYAYEMS